MKAFKTFSQAPENEKPEGIPEEWPWQVQDYFEEKDPKGEQKQKLEELGFKIVTEDEFTEYQRAREDQYNEWDAQRPKKIEPVTPRQFRQALILRGVSMAQIEVALDSLPEPTKSLAKVEWEYSLAFIRTNPLVNQVGSLLG